MSTLLLIAQLCGAIIDLFGEVMAIQIAQASNDDEGRSSETA
jgi:hypothetical protein